MKISALNVDFHFDGSSLDFLGSRKPAHKGIKERYPRKSGNLTDVGQSFVKTIGMGMLPITTNTIVTSFFSRINIDDFERAFTSKIRVFISFCDLRLQRTLLNFDEHELLGVIGFRASREH